MCKEKKISCYCSHNFSNQRLRIDAINWNSISVIPTFIYQGHSTFDLLDTRSRKLQLIPSNNNLSMDHNLLFVCSVLIDLYTSSTNSAEHPPTDERIQIKYSIIPSSFLHFKSSSAFSSEWELSIVRYQRLIKRTQQIGGEIRFSLDVP